MAQHCLCRGWLSTVYLLWEFCLFFGTLQPELEPYPFRQLGYAIRFTYLISCGLLLLIRFAQLRFEVFQEIFAAHDFVGAIAEEMDHGLKLLLSLIAAYNL